MASTAAAAGAWSTSLFGGCCDYDTCFGTYLNSESGGLMIQSACLLLVYQLCKRRSAKPPALCRACLKLALRPRRLTHTTCLHFAGKVWYSMHGNTDYPSAYTCTRCGAHPPAGCSLPSSVHSLPPARL